MLHVSYIVLVFCAFVLVVVPLEISILHSATFSIFLRNLLGDSLSGCEFGCEYVVLVLTVVKRFVSEMTCYVLSEVLNS